MHPRDSRATQGGPDRDGRFTCAAPRGGCIALSAGGTLDTCAATFVSDCPGSPSGAFL